MSIEEDDTPGGAPDEAKVFLSYSRKDRERAQGVADALRARHFGVFKDTDDILPTEEWKTRLEELIAEADTIVFLLSPHSATSEVCAWEVEYATELNKRIAPIVIDDVESSDIPPLLARLNFIFCTPRDPFENAVDTLASALSTDIDWIREHTRLAGLGRRWEQGGRPTRLLLRGQDIADSETWRDAHPSEAPAVTRAQAGFIAESRKAAGRRQRNWVFGSLGVTVATAALAIFAYFQSVEADVQRGVAEANAAEAEQQKAAALRERDQALTTQSLFLAGLSTQLSDAGDDGDALALALEALPQAPTLDSRPLIPEALEALRNARRKLRIETRFPKELGISYGLAAGPTGGRLVMAMSQDGLLYDAEAGKILAAYAGYENAASAAAYSPAGDTFAISAIDGLVTVFDAATSEPTATFDAGARPSVLAYGPGGRRLAIGVADKGDSNLVVIDPATGVVLYRWDGYLGAVTGLAFDPAGDYLFSSSIGGFVRLFDLRNGTALGAVHNDDYGLMAIAMKRDEPVLAVAESEAVIVKNLVTGEDLARFAIGISPLKLVFDPAGDLFAGYVDGTIVRWRIGRETPVDRFAGHQSPILALAVSAQGERLYASSVEDSLIVWRPNDDGLLEETTEAYRNGAASGLDGDGRPIHVDAHQTGARIARPERDEIILPLASPLVDAGLDNDRITTAEQSGRVTVWSLAGDRLGAVDTGIANITFARLDGDVIVAGDRDAGVSLFRYPSGERIDLPGGALVEPGRWALSNGVFAYHGEDRLTAMNLSKANSSAVTADIPDGMFDLALSPDGRLVALGRQGGPDEIRDTASGRLIASLDEPANEAATSFAFSPDGTYLAASGLAGGYLAIWRTADWTPIRIFRNDAGAGKLVFSANSALLAFDNNRDGRIEVVRAKDGKRHMALPGDGNSVIYLAFSKDDERLLVATTGSTRVWPVYPDDAVLIEGSAKIAARAAPLTPEDRCRYFLSIVEACAVEEERRAIVATIPLPED